MKSTLCAVVALVAAVVSVPAFAEDSTWSKHCTWQKGKYVCEERSISASSSSTTTCETVGPNHDTDCRTSTVVPEPPAPPVTFSPDAWERARQRAAENEKAGRKGVEVCGPDRWVKDHWEPSCR